MRTIDVETWASRILAMVEAGRRIEDSRVELKAELPEPTKSARRIAAHANGAFSEPILWLIGVDETKGITGAKVEDLADWFPKVKAAFDGAYPPMKDVVVPTKGTTVLCLVFDTSRAPFMVKNPTGGTIQREIPWREGTMTRTATRDELLALLRPDEPSPQVEILAANLRASPRDAGGLSVEGRLKIYLVPKTERMLVIPFHRCSAQILEGGKIVCEGLEVEIHNLRKLTMSDIRGAISRLRGTGPQSVTIKRETEPLQVEDYQAVFYRPAMFTMSISGKVLSEVWSGLKEPVIQVAMRSAFDETRAVVLAAKFPLSTSGSFSFGESWL